MMREATFRPGQWVVVTPKDPGRWTWHLGLQKGCQGPTTEGWGPSPSRA